jgi:hypothetical protein
MHETSPPRRMRHSWEARHRLMRLVWSGSRETYGAPRIHAELRIAHQLRLGGNVLRG